MHPLTRSYQGSGTGPETPIAPNRESYPLLSVTRTLSGSSFPYRRLSASPLFDDVTGFGGDGADGTYTLPPDPQNISFTNGPYTFRGCVRTGSFATHTTIFGPGLLKTEHCLVRGIDERYRAQVTSDNVQITLSKKTYADFTTYIDDLYLGIHGGGHLLVGGEMTNIYSAGVGERG